MGAAATGEGSCACGAVRFQFELPSLFFAHCHCEDCRRAHGAPVVSWVGVREPGFRLLAGESALRWHASSVQGRRGFCSSCGTPLLFQSGLCPGEMHIARPAIRTALDREPGGHVFYDRRVDWLTVSDALPRLAAHDPELAAFRAVEYRE